LLTTTTTAAQAEESLDNLIAAGWPPESNTLHSSHYRLAVPPVVATYANAYGRFGVADNLCGFSYAATPSVAVRDPACGGIAAQIFGTFGVGLNAGINIVNNQIG
jgi:hydroxybutyrate-dimer hydrolase